MLHNVHQREIESDIGHNILYFNNKCCYMYVYFLATYVHALYFTVYCYISIICDYCCSNTSDIVYVIYCYTCFKHIKLHTHHTLARRTKH